MYKKSVITSEYITKLIQFMRDVTKQFWFLFVWREVQMCVWLIQTIIRTCIVFLHHLINFLEILYFEKRFYRLLYL